MIDCKDFTVADGQPVSEDLTFCCLSNGDLTDGFIVSGFLDNQSFTIQSYLSCGAFLTATETPVINIAEKEVLSIRSNHTKERTVSVKCSQSSFYRISKQISDLISITIDNLKSFVAVCRRTVKKVINKMKGKQNKCRVYTLCLLRL